MNIEIPETIGNFDINLEAVEDLHITIDSKEYTVSQARLTMTPKDGFPSESVTVPLKEGKPGGIKWGDLRFCHLNSDVSKAEANEKISNAIGSVLDDVPKVDVYKLGHTGVHKIGGTHVFCAGSESIQPSSDAAQRLNIELDSMPQRLDYNSNLSEVEAASETLNLISLSPGSGRVVLTLELISLMRQLYVDAGKRPSFSVFIYGPSGTQKTTLVSFITQVYNRSDGIVSPPRLNASPSAAVQLIMEAVDSVVVLDDLFPADSIRVRKGQEETLFEVVRYIGDGTIPLRMKGKQMQEGHPRCLAIFTGEYLIGKGSDAARLLTVRMEKPNTRALKYYQDRPLTISTFYRNFIYWFINNYDEIVNLLRKWAEEYNKTDLGVHDRLSETHFFLNTAYTLFLQYCREKDVLTEDDKNRLQRNFVDMLNKLVHEQNNLVGPTERVSLAQGNYLERIKELYRKGQFNIVPKFLFNRGQHDGVIHTDCLCLHENALRRFFPSSDPSDIGAELDAQGALNKSKDGNLKKKISGARGNYFYCIPLNRL